MSESRDRFPVLILVDIQAGFRDPCWGRRSNPELEKNAAALLARWRDRRAPLYHVQHLSTEPRSPLRPGQPGVELMEEVRPRTNEPIIQKRVNSAFIGTDLEARLRAQGHRSLLLAGLATDHCVSTTARMAANLGFHVRIAADATATFDRRACDGEIFPAELVHAVSLASLQGEFAEVLPTSALLEELI